MVSNGHVSRKHIISTPMPHSKAVAPIEFYAMPHAYVLKYEKRFIFGFSCNPIMYPHTEI